MTFPATVNSLIDLAMTFINCDGRKGCLCHAWFLLNNTNVTQTQKLAPSNLQRRPVCALPWCHQYWPLLWHRYTLVRQCFKVCTAQRTDTPVPTLDLLDWLDAVILIWETADTSVHDLAAEQSLPQACCILLLGIRLIS